MTRLDTTATDKRIVGRSLNRVDGPIKVTGRATYAYENATIGEALVGVFATATIGTGEITAIDTAAAEAMPGVRLVVTHVNVPEPGGARRKPWRLQHALTTHHAGHADPPFRAARRPRHCRDVRAGARCGPRCRGAICEGPRDVRLHRHRPRHRAGIANVAPAATDRGDFEGGFARAAFRIDQTYDTPAHYSQPMEPHATLARWEGEVLHLTTSHQTLQYIQTSLANSLSLTPENLVVSAPFVGGAFGSKLSTHGDIMGAAIAARMLGEPVKVCFTRQQVFSLGGGRPWQRQRVRLGADAVGGLVAIGHEALVYSNERDPFVEQTAIVTRSLYAEPDRMTRHRIAHLDLHGGEAVRAPGEMPGLLAVESAMDELAEELGIDPVELRLRNDTDTDPESGVPLTGRRLAECLRTGADRFGWQARAPQPRARQDGQWLLGMGVASAIRMHFQGETEVEVAVTPEGRVEVRSDLTDIDTGSYTVLGQVAAEVLGVGHDAIDVVLADTRLPTGGGSGGSWGASNTAAALHAACLALLEKTGTAPGTEFAQAVLTAHPGGITARGGISSMGDVPDWNEASRHTYGTQFAEVAVHRLTGEVQVRRMLGVFAAGRILNAKTARSQLLGGMVWGLSAALREGIEIDPRHGNIVNGDLAEYLLPVHADVPDIDIVLLDEPDLAANPVGVKGVGELGACGASAAVANALYNASGVRVQSFPAHLGTMVPQLA